MSKIKKTLVIVNGFPQSGKSTFMDYCIIHLSKKYQMISETDEYYIIMKHGTADTPKEVAITMGWDESKTPENREMLSVLKDFYTKYFDGPLNEIKQILSGKKNTILFTAMREPEEITKTVKWAKSESINVVTVAVRGAKEENIHKSHSDKDVMDYDYDVYIYNDKDIEELKRLSEIFSSMVDYESYREDLLEKIHISEVAKQ